MLFRQSLKVRLPFRPILRLRHCRHKSKNTLAFGAGDAAKVVNNNAMASRTATIFKPPHTTVGRGARRPAHQIMRMTTTTPTRPQTRTFRLLPRAATRTGRASLARMELTSHLWGRVATHIVPGGTLRITPSCRWRLVAIRTARCHRSRATATVRQRSTTSSDRRTMSTGVRRAGRRPGRSGAAVRRRQDVQAGLAWGARLRRLRTAWLYGG